MMATELERLRLKALQQMARERAQPPTRAKQASELIKNFIGTVETGLTRGVGSLLGIPGTIQQLEGAGLRRGAEALGVPGGDIGGAIQRAAGGVGLSIPKPSIPQMPTGPDITQGLLSAREAITGLKPYEPTTPAGRVFQETVAAIPFPGSKAVNIAAGLGGALAGEATRGTAAEIPARIAGGVVGGAIPGISQVMRSAPQRLMREAVGIGGAREPVSLQRAEELQAAAGRAAMPITGAEAIAQAQGSNPQLLGWQRVIEQSRRGGPIMNEMMRQRGPAVEAGVKTAIDAALGPPPAEVEKIPGRVQTAAQALIDRAVAARTKATTQLYQAAKPQTVPPERINAILGDIDDVIARDKTGILRPKLAELRSMLTLSPATKDAPRVPVTDIENLDRARKYMRDQIKLPDIAAGAIPKEVALTLKRPLKRLKEAMAETSLEFAQGRARHERISEQIVEPLVKGPIGQLAGTTAKEPQAGILLPKIPKFTSPSNARIIVRQLSKSDPTVVQNFAHEYLSSQFAENMRRGDAWSGGNFFKAIAGNPKQREILRAVIEELPGGAERWQGFKTFLNVLEAQGRRLAPGSPTAENLRKAGEAGAGRIAWPSFGQMNQWLEEFRYGRNTEKMARLLTDPESVKKIRQLALLKPDSDRAQVLVSELLIGPREIEQVD